jgi:AcrR family transcriptional regulator
VKTRDRILEAARGLFNEEGLPQVSSNRIAAELGISPGNLHYHFRRKEDIVAWLLRRFAESLRPFADAHESVHAIDDLWLTLHLTFEAIDHYRFIYRDIDYLMREYPALQGAARELTAERLEAMRRVYEKLAAGGVIAADGEQLEALALQTVLTTTAWYSFGRLTAPSAQQGAGGDSSGAAAYHLLMLLSPYVNDDARRYLEYLRSKYVRAGAALRDRRAG